MFRKIAYEVKGFLNFCPIIPQLWRLVWQVDEAGRS